MNSIEQLKMKQWAYEVRLIAEDYHRTDLKFMSAILGVSEEQISDRILRLTGAGYLDNCSVDFDSKELVMKGNTKERDDIDYDANAFVRCRKCGTLISCRDRFCLFCGKPNKHYIARVEKVQDFDDAYSGVKRGIRMVRLCSDGMDDTELTEGLDAMISKTRKMCDYVSDNDELQNDPDVNRLLDFYLPKTFESINDFYELYEREEDQDVMDNINDELKYTVNAVNDVFDDIFDKINNEKIMDLSTDLISLRNMIELNSSGKEELKPEKDKSDIL